MNFSEKIIELYKKDLELREKLILKGDLFDGYHLELKKLHNENAEELKKIIEIIGFPNNKNFDEKTINATWLIIQHAIEKPDFMKFCLKKMNDNKDFNSIKIAYLTDRIAFFEGKPQQFGTQFDWDEFGNLSPHLYDDLKKVNKRRKSIGLDSIQEQTEIIRNQAIKENQKPPINFKKRKEEFNIWRKKVGWI